MSNCPQCGVGVIEQIGYIEIKQGPLEIVLQPMLPEHAISAITIGLCSREPCNYMAWEAAPGSLTLGKRLIRDLMLPHSETATNKLTI